MKKRMHLTLCLFTYVFFFKYFPLYKQISILIPFVEVIDIDKLLLWVYVIGLLSNYADFDFSSLNNATQ